MDPSQDVTKSSREALKKWKESLKENFYEQDINFKHSLKFYFKNQFDPLNKELSLFSKQVFKNLESLVNENDLTGNNPRLESYSDIGEKEQKIVHHPAYREAGDIIYASGLMEKMSYSGGLLESLCFFFLSSHAGEAGHNCPIACSAGIIRVLQKVDNIPQKETFLQGLIKKSYRENLTGAQFLTEIQGGSDVGKNATYAFLDSDQKWKIKGEKWFCSNADAELILLTARFDQNKKGTKGLGLFLLPSHLPTGERNHYTLRRLKNKIGTRSMASAEIDFESALAWPVGRLENGFQLVMENVLHISRIFNTFSVLGLSSRAYQIASSYAQYREAFGKKINQFPLIQETLAKVKSEQLALMALIFKTTSLQDECDLQPEKEGNEIEEQKLLLRVLANLSKYISSLWAVEHIHRAIDILGGNGAIETFSPLPRLLRDALVCENWEGTHNTLRMQILRDIHRYRLDRLFMSFLKKELAKIPDDLELKKFFLSPIENLEKSMESLLTKNEALQTLLIKDLVDQMSFLPSALFLLQEAIHQQKTEHNEIKNKATLLFLRIHFSSSKLFCEYDEDYLKLIEDIIAYR